MLSDRLDPTHWAISHSSDIRPFSSLIGISRDKNDTLPGEMGFFYMAGWLAQKPMM